VYGPARTNIANVNCDIIFKNTNMIPIYCNNVILD